MRHRVLHFLWSGGIGGPPRAIYQLAKEEVAQGEWDVGVAFGRAQGIYAEALKALGCEVIDLKMRTGADICSALRAVKDLQRFDIHHFHSLELGQMVASLRCRGTTRVYTHRHGMYMPPEPAAKRVRRAVGAALLRRNFHAVAGNTQHATRFIVSRYRLQHLPSQVTYNGLDFSLLEPERNRAEIRRELGIEGDGMVVGSSGALKFEKRFDLLVNVLDSPAVARVLLVGDGVLRPALEAQARRLKARDRLHITGVVENVVDYVQAMDAFVLPSSAEESFGNSVVEAMALGVPSIVFSDSPGLCEHIENGVTGFIVEDQEELVSTLERLCAEPDLRLRIGHAGSEHVRSKYSLANMHESYRRLYQMALDSREA